VSRQTGELVGGKKRGKKTLEREAEGKD